ncbi:MAG: hypothetical protein WC802_04695 [Patescibacteria group bacterium]|jgi:hypothetical protein
MQKSLLSIALLMLLGVGCAQSSTIPAPASNYTVPDVVIETPPSKVLTFEFTEDPRYSFSFPERWMGIKNFEDFDGYGPKEEFLAYDVPGKSRAFYYEPKGEDLLYLFAIMSIDLKDQSKMAKYPTEKLLGSNATSAFYGGVVAKTGPWSYIYDGRQDKYVEQMKDIDQIFASFKAK